MRMKPTGTVRLSALEEVPLEEAACTECGAQVWARQGSFDGEQALTCYHCDPAWARAKMSAAQALLVWANGVQSRSGWDSHCQADWQIAESLAQRLGLSSQRIYDLMRTTFKQHELALKPQTNAV